MSADTVLEKARRFIADHIGSVAQLDLLLLLRTTAERSWTVDAMSRELRVDPAWAELQAIHLCDRGLLTKSQSGDSSGARATFQYNPGTEALREGVTALAQAYLLHRVSVIESIYSKPPPSIKAFADAFKLRGSREPNHG